MSDIIDFLEATIPGAETVYVFDVEDPDNGVNVPLAEAEEAALRFAHPMLSLCDESDTIHTVGGGTKGTDTFSIRMTSQEHDLLDLFYLVQPMAVDDVPEEFLIEVPFPVDMWGFDFNAEDTAFEIHEGELVPVFQLDEESNDHVEMDEECAPQVAVEAADGAGHEDQHTPDGDQPDEPADCDAGVVGELEGADSAAGQGSPEPSDASETGSVSDQPDPEVGSDEPEGGKAPGTLNDAILLGDESNAAMAELFNREVTFMTGELWGARDRRNTQDKDWKPFTTSCLNMILGFDKSGNSPEFGLSRHTASKFKEGPCIVLGSSIGGARKAKAMETMYAMGLDIDSGATLEFVKNRILELGLFATIYTSYSHGKAGLQLKRDDVLRKLAIKTDPTLEEVQQYLREFDKNRYEESFIQQVTIKTAKKQVADGVVIELDTPPLDKFRVIFFLKEPVKLVDLAETQQECLDIWEDSITGLAHKILGVHFDTSCTDPSRLFYTARHPKGADNWQCYILQGQPLDFHAVPRVKKSQYTQNRELNAFVEADDLGEAGKPPTVFAPSGASLNEWHSKFGKARFQIADLLQSYCPDKIRVSGGEKAGMVHTECPFEGMHTSEGGTATFAMDALDSNSGYWTWKCHHDACQGRHKLEFLSEALTQGWFEEDLLMSDEFLLPPDDGEIDEEADAERIAAAERVANGEPEAPPEPKDPVTLAEKLPTDTDTPEKDIRKLYKKLHRRGIDAVMRNRVNKVIQKRFEIGLKELKSFWTDLDREKASKEGPEESSLVPKVNEMDFRDLCKYGQNRIDKANAEDRQLFHYMEKLAVIRDDAHGNGRIKFLDERGFAHFLNTVARFERSSGEKSVRGVNAPQEVVNHLFAADYSIYPPLRGIITSPCFSQGGKLILERGYHSESALFYQPNNALVVPPISEAPTADEVKEAKRLLIEECFADFPLGAKTRPEIVEQGMDPEGEGLPALANLIALTLLPFMREMVVGATPGHLLTKPAPGTGASLLTDVVSVIANGETTPAMAMPTNKDEMGKTLTSVLANGQNFVFFDNINHSVDSGELASAMTTPTYAARQLGKSQTIEVEVRCVWVFTGNNVMLSNELIRRLLMIDLNARVSHPEKRTGWRHSDIMGYVKKNRGVLVWACLTLIQNWVAAGKPEQNDVVLASYENWSRAIGGVLAEAGIRGFMGNREELREQSVDSETDDLQIMIEEWWEAYGTQPIQVKSKDPAEPSVQRLCHAHEIDLPVKIDRRDEDQMYSAQGLGSFLSKYRARLFEVGGQTVCLNLSQERNRRGKMWSLTINDNAKPESNV